MQSFSETAFYWLLWRAILIVLGSAVLLVTQWLPVTAALLVAGHIALVCALVLMAAANRLDGERVVRSKAWRSLRPSERPFGEGGRIWASNCLKEQMLRFAGFAAGFAALASASAMAAA